MLAEVSVAKLAVYQDKLDKARAQCAAKQSTLYKWLVSFCTPSAHVRGATPSQPPPRMPRGRRALPTATL